MPIVVAEVLARARRQSTLHELVLVGVTVGVWVGAWMLSSGDPVVAVLPGLFVVPGVAAVSAQRFMRAEGQQVDDLSPQAREAVRAAARIVGVGTEGLSVLVFGGSPGVRGLPHPVRMVGSPRRPVVVLDSDAMGLPVEELTALLVHEFSHVAAGHLGVRHQLVSAMTQRLALSIGVGVFLAGATSDWWSMAGVAWALTLAGYQWSILRCRAFGTSTPGGLPSWPLVSLLLTGLGAWYLPALFMAWGGMPVGAGLWGAAMFVGLRCLWLGLAQRSETCMDDVAAVAGLGGSLADGLERLSGRHPGILQRVFATHPPVALRLRRLRRFDPVSR